ncbi:MAG: hypothetical protein M1308_15250 [Actinobacteria bacterium]|nr:hypothetical protein [Actinomycetota bacterium]
MRKGITLPLIIICCGIILFLVSGYLFYFSSKPLQASETELISPLNVESGITNFQITSGYESVKSKKTTENYPPNKYFPINLTPKFNIALTISAKSYAVMDRDSGELLLGKNITDEKAIASVTKVMTAVVTLEKEKLTKEIAISKKAATIGEATMGLSEGEVYTLEDLLYGLLMVSGNDSAEVISENLGRGRYWFINEMNKKALNLGMYDTYYVNPTGLDEDTLETSSFSTALDLLGLTNYALDNPKFAEIVSTKYKTIPYKENFHKEIFLENILSFDKSYPGIKGVKTGNTDFARQTLISYVERNQRRIIAVLLDSEATRDDAIKIYKYIFEGIVD